MIYLLTRSLTEIAGKMKNKKLLTSLVLLLAGSLVTVVGAVMKMYHVWSGQMLLVLGTAATLGALGLFAYLLIKKLDQA